jgi:NAD(P)-dependent dehydrogenase (short-subunit alcohol dehydrogenase family)
MCRIVGAARALVAEMAEQLADTGVNTGPVVIRPPNVTLADPPQRDPACRLTVLPVNVTDTDSLEQAVQAIVNMRTRHGHWIW